MMNTIRSLVLIKINPVDPYGEFQAVAISGPSDVQVCVPDMPAEFEKSRGKYNCTDLILIDLSFNEDDSKKTIKQSQKEGTCLKLLIHRFENPDQNIVMCVRDKANAYPFEDDLQAESLTTRKGHHESEITTSVVSKVIEMESAAQAEAPLESVDLTFRELEILRLLANGHSNKAISDQLNISLYTVKNHVHHILDKLKIHNRSEAMLFALRNGIVDQR